MGEYRGENGFWKQLWGLKLPGKVINLVWRACKGVLPTTTELVKRMVNVSPICSWCHRYAETPLHVLFTCSFA